MPRNLWAQALLIVIARYLLDRWELPFFDSRGVQWVLAAVVILAVAQVVMNLYDGAFRGRVNLASRWNSQPVGKRENPAAFWASIAFYVLIAGSLLWAFVVIVVYL